MYYIWDFDELQQGILNINQTGLGITLYNNVMERGTQKWVVYAVQFQKIPIFYPASD